MTRRRFVIAADGLSKNQQDELRDYLRTQGAWWHWIDNLWLLTTKDDKPSVKEIRDRIVELNSKARAVVFEFPEDDTWAATGTKNSSGKKMADWLRSPWGDNE